LLYIYITKHKHIVKTGSMKSEYSLKDLGPPVKKSEISPSTIKKTITNKVLQDVILNASKKDQQSIIVDKNLDVLKSVLITHNVKKKLKSAPSPGTTAKTSSHIATAAGTPSAPPAHIAQSAPPAPQIIPPANINTWGQQASLPQTFLDTFQNESTIVFDNNDGSSSIMSLIYAFPEIFVDLCVNYTYNKRPDDSVSMADDTFIRNKMDRILQYNMNDDDLYKSMAIVSLAIITQHINIKSNIINNVIVKTDNSLIALMNAILVIVGIGMECNGAVIGNPKNVFDYASIQITQSNIVLTIKPPFVTKYSIPSSFTSYLPSNFIQQYDQDGRIRTVPLSRTDHVFWFTLFHSKYNTKSSCKNIVSTIQHI